jgi:hypothetical protein
VHDALVGTKGAFDEEMRGLKNALAHREATGLPIVNVDVVVNRANVRHLDEMLSMLLELGVREFDLLQVVPFGRAFRDGRDTLFYDLEEARPHIQAALAYSTRPDVHLWMNRFPPQHLEGFEHLIQDPYKLNDEVRGRKEEFARWIDTGEPLDCRDPARCRYCYLEKLCDSLVQTMDSVASGAFEIVRVDTEAEAHAPSSFGGDPATARKRLPLAGNGASIERQRRSLSEILASSRARTLHVVAPNVPRAIEAASRFPSLTDLELRLEDWSGLEAIAGRLTRVEARTAEAAQALLAIAGSFEVVVDVTKDTAPWLLSLDEAPARLALSQPTYERASDAREHDVDLRTFFGSFRHAAVPVEGVPACILGREPRRRPAMMDLAAADPGGRLEIFRWTRRYVEERYVTRSLRCSSCVHAPRCEGVHVNFVRAHGYSPLQPVTDPLPPRR